MTPTELTDDVLGILRREFFKPGDARSFFKQRDFLKEAICYPARYLNDRGARLVGSKYRVILLTVIEAIKKHADRGAIEYFARYFLTCVQAHMRHHGEDYYNQAKRFDGRATTPRPIRAIVSGALRTMPAGGEDRTVETLAAAHRALSSRRRIQKVKKTARELDLFDACKTNARRVQDDR